MIERHTADAIRFARMTTAEVRDNFLVASLFRPDDLCMIYWHVDRAVVGSAVPQGHSLELMASKELAADFFCERREIGIINVGDGGTVTVDGTQYAMAHLDCLYVGRGSRTVTFDSANAASPAMFYLVSYPSHATYPTTHAKKADAEPVTLGSSKECNERTIYKYIHPAGVPSSQLVMGFTELREGSVWNTMPAHLHPRRSELYMYFGIDEDAQVFHFMGKPEETRHIAMRNHQVVLSPSWSIHSGVGTANYAFIWAMGGENQDFSDVDGVPVPDLH